MKKIIENPALIIAIALVILGGIWGGLSYVKFAAAQTQAQAELTQKEEELFFKKQVERGEALEREQKTRDLNLCLIDADAAYWSYMKLNGTEKDDGIILAETRFWDRAEKKKQNAIDNCYKQYK